VITAKELDVPTQFLTRIVGISFSSNYPDNIFAIAQEVATKTARCELVREPNNVHDTNSIRVDINNVAIGHLPRLIAMVLAPNIDKGNTWLAEVDSIVISNENINQPGLKINVWRQQNATL
jgi:hypothetical protein